MSRQSLLLSVALCFLSACATAPEQGDAFPAVEARGIRDLGYGPFFVDFLAIKAGTEDRVVLEFDIHKRPRRFERMVLKVPYANFDERGDAGVIEVYAFQGDGLVKPHDFYAGELVGRKIADEDGAVRIDVTEAVKASMDAGEQFIGLRLSTATSDRYLLGSIVGLRDPVLRIAEDD